MSPLISCLFTIFTFFYGNRTREKSCSENLLYIFGNQLPQPSYLQKNEEQVECGICYAQYLPTGSIFDFQFVDSAIAATTHKTKLNKAIPRQKRIDNHKFFVLAFQMMNLVPRVELQLIIHVKMETAIEHSTVFVLVIGSALLRLRGSKLCSHKLTLFYVNVHDNHLNY